MKILLVINLQIDFCSGGAVGIEGGEALVPLANAWMSKFDRVIGVRDWHPAEHVSFASTHLWRRPGQVMQVGERSQLLWHMHCVQDSFGAEWAKDLQAARFDTVIDKGTDANSKGYSAFAGTDLENYLRVRDATSVYLLGMATEFDVKYTALDAVNLGFETFVIQEACRALNSENEAAALERMKQEGVRVVAGF